MKHIQIKLFGSQVDSLSSFIKFSIIINLLFIVLDSFHIENNKWYSSFVWIDYCCAWSFVFEAISKIYRFNWQTYISKTWNKFDLTIVLLSSPILLMPFFDVDAFGVLITLRLARLIRFFKLLSFIPRREHLITGIKRALKASIGVLLGLSFLLIFASLSSALIFGQISPEYFGNPFVSSYSMFKLFTIEGWYEIPELLMQAKEGFWWPTFVTLYFSVFLVVGGIIGISMLNAVFIDALVEDNNEEVEKQLIEIGKRFDRLEVLLHKFVTHKEN